MNCGNYTSAFNGEQVTKSFERSLRPCMKSPKSFILNKSNMTSYPCTRGASIQAMRSGRGFMNTSTCCTREFHLQLGGDSFWTWPVHGKRAS